MNAAGLTAATLDERHALIARMQLVLAEWEALLALASPDQRPHLEIAIGRFRDTLHAQS
jgi:hypothetical protein